jgi:hypothetical protein
MVKGRINFSALVTPYRLTCKVRASSSSTQFNTTLNRNGSTLVPGGPISMRYTKRSLIALATLAGVLSAPAVRMRAQAGDTLPFKATETTLANGLKVIVVPTGFPNLVSVQIPVQVGTISGISEVGLSSRTSPGSACRCWPRWSAMGTSRRNR